jgi:hypothetical protein
MTPRFAHRMRAAQRAALQNYGRMRGRAAANIRCSRHCILLTRKAIANGR